MKKIILIITASLIIFTNMDKQTKDDYIRIRILANSNSLYDQNLKKNISTDISNMMYNLLKDETTKENARQKILENTNLLDELLKEKLKNESYSYTINYGKNYFPEKKYNNKTYDSGEYESLLITLGEGKGDNWWCILFPPFCLIDAEKTTENVEYTTLFDTIFTKLLNK